jgi:hypothetical protein
MEVPAAAAFRIWKVLLDQAHWLTQLYSLFLVTCSQELFGCLESDKSAYGFEQIFNE